MSGPWRCVIRAVTASVSRWIGILSFWRLAKPSCCAMAAKLQWSLTAQWFIRHCRPLRIWRRLESNGLLDRVRVVRMGIPDRIVTHGDPKLLLAKYGLDADGIYTRVREAIEVLEDRRAKHIRVTA